MILKLLTLLALLALFVVTRTPENTTSIESSEMADSTDLVLNGSDFETGTHSGTLANQHGLTLAATDATGQYTSPIINSAQPFNAIVPQWLAEVPDSASMTIRLRTATTGNEWSDWFLIVENHDWMLPEDEDIVGQMIVVPEADGTHQKIQFEISFTRSQDGPAAELEELRLTIIDSTAGPTAEELQAEQARLEQAQPESSESGYPKPQVVSRSVWCTDPACNYSSGLEYRSVTHLIVHHTVSSNSSSNWAATVRAIWQFHTFSRGWGDIGYNYLVDMNGVLYEGHLGGDDVVGTHAAGANAGSMALSFIGTFTTPDYNPPGIAPPQAMKNAAVELFSWKADQKNINVYDASRLPNMDWGLPHLMGHRDAYGTTECPGTQAHDIIPWLRDEISRKIGFVSPHIYVDELSSAFSKNSSEFWYVPPKNCGFNGHAYYTWSTNNPANSSNWGEWRPNLPRSDYYQVEVYAPYCVTGRGETAGAKYQVTHANGVNNVTVNHQANVGTWMNLGTFYFNAGNSGKIHLTDVTTTDSGLGVWFDAIRFRPSSALPTPTVGNSEPAQNNWLGARNVNFKWSITNGILVSKTRLQVATNSSFENIIVNQEFNGAVTSHAHTFNQDYNRLYWRVKISTTQGSEIYSAVTFFGIDTEPPSSSIYNIFRMSDDTYVPVWAGNDTGSGVAAYNIDYREEGGSWIRLLSNYNGTNTTFRPPNSQKAYEFRSQAIDGVGKLEPQQDIADISTRDAIPVEPVIIQPLILMK